MCEEVAEVVSNLASADWKKLRLSDLGQYHNGVAFKPADWVEDGLPIIRIEQLNNPNGEFDRYAGLVAENNRIRNGDLIFSWSATLKAIIWRHGDAVVNQHLFKVVPKPNIDIQFLHYVLDFNMEALGNGSHGSTMKHIKRSELDKFFVPVPPTARQRKIATILSTIDTAIEKTEALIEKYQHIKAGLMHDLFTRGVLPNGQLRPPREQAPELYQETAMGWIPKEWAISSCGQRCSIDSGITLGPHRRPLRNVQPYLRVGNIYRDEIRLDCVSMLEALPSEADMVLKTFDMLVVEGHANRAEIGRCAMVHNDAEGMLFQNHLFRLRTTDLLATYALLWMNSHFSQQYWERTCATSSGLNTINRKMLQALPFLVPSQIEQSRITAAASVAKERIQKELTKLEKLQHQKLGLMQDLLTGKVAVKVNAQVPELVDG